MNEGFETFQRLIVERRGPVGWLIFNRPDRRNAIDIVMFAELERAWRALDDHPGVRVIVNAAAGDHFQSGVDLGQVSADRESLKRFSRQTRDAELRLTGWHNQVRKPVIVAVNGTCAGGGLHFVADADIVVVASDVIFIDPHVSVGQATAYEGIALAQKNPAGTMMRLALLGRHGRLGAAEALRLGWTSQVVDPPEALHAEVQRLAELVAGQPSDQQAIRKAALWRALETTRAASLSDSPDPDTQWSIR